MNQSVSTEKSVERARNYIICVLVFILKKEYFIYVLVFIRSILPGTCGKFHRTISYFFSNGIGIFVASTW